MLAPHPDDEVFGCGGAIASHVALGQPVCVVVLTDGALYGDALTRQHESCAAAAVLGYGVPEFWAYPDRGLVYSEALVQQLADKIASTNSDLVYAPSPWEIHPDHQQTCRLAIEAVRRAGAGAGVGSDIRIAFYEIGAPLRPNVLLDLTPLLAVKETAMRCFGSQLEQQDYVGHIQALNRYRSYTLSAAVAAAEAYWVLTAQALEAVCDTPLPGLIPLGSLDGFVAAPVLDKDFTLPGQAGLWATDLALAPAPALASEPDLATNLPINPATEFAASFHTMTPQNLQAVSLDAPHPLAMPVMVSVLIRTTNRASLAQAIASVAAQSFTQWEIVVVNASGQPLTPLSPEFARQVTRLIEPGVPLGRSAAANALLDAATGQYALFLDDDDQLLPAHLQKLVHALSSATDTSAGADLVACYSDVQATIADQGDKPARSHLYQREFDPLLLQLQNYLPIHAVLFKLDVARSKLACRFDEHLAMFEDWDFWLQLAGKGAFKRVPGVSALYALNAASGSGHTQAESALREAALLQFAERQLGRWDAEGIAKLVSWQGLRLQDEAQAQQTANSLKTQLTRASHDITRLAHAEANAGQTIVRLQTQLTQVSQDAATQRNLLESQLQHAVATVDNTQQLLQKTEQSLQETRAYGFAQHMEIEKLGRVRTEHLQQLAQLNERLLATYQSRSWRFTRPLRGATRVLNWLKTPKPQRLVRNGLLAVRGEVRRHGALGFARRLPHFLRHARTYVALLTSPLPEAKASTFGGPAPSVQALRLHPDLTEVTTPIDASISVVIPTYNAGTEFKWLLRKLMTQRGLKNLEVVVVDSGSSDNTVLWAQQAGCRVVEITQAEFTHSHARNLGAAHAQSDYVLFMVQDAYPVGDYWAYGMLRYLLDHAGQGLVAASCSEYPRSDSDMMYDAMINVHYRFLGCHAQDRLGDFQGSDHMALRSRGQLSDVACLISRKMFGEYGYQGDYAEDLDLGIRLIKDGHKVAMLASVKVVHSHNRAAFYYLKRSYVDVIFLVGMFEDFTFPPVESVPGLLAGIVSGASHVSALLPTLEDAAPGLQLSDVLAQWIAVCKARCQVLKLDGTSTLGDAKLDNYINALAQRLNAAELDSVARSQAQRLIDTFFARLEHFNTFAADVYGPHDAGLREALQHVVRKTFAAAAGSALGFMYMDKQASPGADQPMVDKINQELRVGV